jgi:hypothetical protein
VPDLQAARTTPKTGNLKEVSLFGRGVCLQADPPVVDAEEA